MDSLIADLAQALGGFEPLSDLVGTEFPDLEVQLATCHYGQTSYVSLGS